MKKCKSKLQLPTKYKINNKHTQQKNDIPVTSYREKNLQLYQIHVNMNICIYVYLCIYIWYIYIYIYIYIYNNIIQGKNNDFIKFMSTWMSTWIYAYMRIYIYMYIYVYICIYVCVCVCVCLVYLYGIYVVFILS